jgi:hypothetical protein
MTGRYLTDLPDVLRSGGVPVVEVDGWKQRGRSSGGFPPGAPLGMVWHHTASGRGASATANVEYATFRAPAKPITGLYLHRDGTWYVCAAGATNTQGRGGPLRTTGGNVPADRGNEYLLGVECGNDGIGEPWPQEQIDSLFTGTIALMRHYHWSIPSDLFFHATYAPGRKIDPARAVAVQGPWRPRGAGTANTWDLADTRAELARRAGHPITTSPPIPAPTTGDIEMRWIIVGNADHPADPVRYAFNGAMMRKLRDEAEAAMYHDQFHAAYTLATPYWLTTAQINSYPIV